MIELIAYGTFMLFVFAMLIYLLTSWMYNRNPQPTIVRPGEDHD